MNCHWSKRPRTFEFLVGQRTHLLRSTAAVARYSSTLSRQRLLDLPARQSQWSSFCLPLSGLSVARSDFAPTGISSFCEMKHGVPQQPIRFGLITTAVGFEPSN